MGTRMWRRDVFNVMYTRSGGGGGVDSIRDGWMRWIGLEVGNAKRIDMKCGE
jgi:hypothetical protein